MIHIQRFSLPIIPCASMLVSCGGGGSGGEESSGAAQIPTSTLEITEANSRQTAQEVVATSDDIIDGGSISMLSVGRAIPTLPHEKD